MFLTLVNRAVYDFSYQSAEVACLELEVHQPWIKQWNSKRAIDDDFW